MIRKKEKPENIKVQIDNLAIVMFGSAIWTIVTIEQSRWDRKMLCKFTEGKISIEKKN